MSCWAFISAVYGQLRGYNRLRVRREVAKNSRLSRDELERRGREIMTARVLDAVARFPEYAEKVKSRLGYIPKDGFSDFEKLPVWTREDQRNLMERLLAEPRRGRILHSTGGSTGVPVQFYITRESYEWRMAVSDRGYLWAGAEEGKRSFYVWGAPIYAPSFTRKLKQGVHHLLQGRTYFNSFDFGDEQKKRCCEKINAIKPLSLVGYAGNLVELARFVRDNGGILSWRSKTVVTAAEGLLPGQRELIQRHLGEKVFCSYGSREFMLIGMECPQHQRYHISSDNLFVEVADDDGRNVKNGETGRILVTDLHNTANPFIRYETGDIGSLSEESCSCGLPFPVLATISGRITEFVELPSGARLTAMFIPHLMKEFPWVRGCQLIQRDKNTLQVNLIADMELTEDMTEPIAVELRRKVGNDMEISFKRVTSLVRSGSGKVMRVIRETN